MMGNADKIVAQFILGLLNRQIRYAINAFPGHAFQN